MVTKTYILRPVLSKDEGGAAGSGSDARGGGGNNDGDGRAERRREGPAPPTPSRSMSMPLPLEPPRQKPLPLMDPGRSWRVQQHQQQMQQQCWKRKPPPLSVQQRQVKPNRDISKNDSMAVTSSVALKVKEEAFGYDTESEDDRKPTVMTSGVTIKQEDMGYANDVDPEEETEISAATNDGVKGEDTDLMDVAEDMGAPVAAMNVFAAFGNDMSEERRGKDPAPPPAKRAPREEAGQQQQQQQKQQQQKQQQQQPGAGPPDAPLSWRAPDMRTKRQWERELPQWCRNEVHAKRLTDFTVGTGFVQGSAASRPRREEGQRKQMQLKYQLLRSCGPQRRRQRGVGEGVQSPAPEPQSTSDGAEDGSNSVRAGEKIEANGGGGRALKAPVGKLSLPITAVELSMSKSGVVIGVFANAKTAAKELNELGVQISHDTISKRMKEGHRMIDRLRLGLEFKKVGSKYTKDDCGFKHDVPEAMAWLENNRSVVGTIDAVELSIETDGVVIGVFANANAAAKELNELGVQISHNTISRRMIEGHRMAGRPWQGMKVKRVGSKYTKDDCGFKHDVPKAKAWLENIRSIVGTIDDVELSIETDGVVIGVFANAKAAAKELNALGVQISHTTIWERMEERCCAFGKPWMGMQVKRVGSKYTKDDCGFKHDVPEAMAWLEKNRLTVETIDAVELSAGGVVIDGFASARSAAHKYQSLRSCGPQRRRQRGVGEGVQSRAPEPQSTSDGAEDGSNSSRASGKIEANGGGSRALRAPAGKPSPPFNAVELSMSKSGVVIGVFATAKAAAKELKELGVQMSYSTILDRMKEGHRMTGRPWQGINVKSFGSKYTKKDYGFKHDVPEAIAWLENNRSIDGTIDTVELSIGTDVQES